MALVTIWKASLQARVLGLQAPLFRLRVVSSLLWPRRSKACTLLLIGTALGTAAPAWGRVDTRSGEPRIPRSEGQVHAGSFRKTYSRDELRRPEWRATAPQIHERLVGEVRDLLNKMASGLSGDQERQTLDTLKTRQPDARRWAESQTLLNGQVETVPTDTGALGTFFASQGQKAAATSAKERLPAIDQLTSFNFNFDLRPGSQSPSQAEAERWNRVRYGLIVKDIQPDLGGVKRASTTTTAEEIAHAGRARVQWGIGPLQESEERPIMTGQEVQNPSRRTFAGLSVPSTKFKGSARAESLSFSGAAPGQLPPWRFDLMQEDRLYNLSYRTQRSAQIGNVEHTINVPVFRTLSVGQRYSETLTRVETSASGVLIDNRLPQVVLHYLHLEERYKAEIQTSVKGSKIGAAARTEVRGATDRPDEASAAYSLTFSRDF